MSHPRSAVGIKAHNSDIVRWQRWVEANLRKPDSLEIRLVLPVGASISDVETLRTVSRVVDEMEAIPELGTTRSLLDGIRRVAENMGRVAGLPDDLLPEVIVSDESVPPAINDTELTQRLRGVWRSALGEDIFYESKRKGMGAEDFPFFTTDPYIPSTYFAVGGTPQDDFDAEEAGGTPVPSHHSPLFKVKGEESVVLGVEATVVALRDLLQVIAR